MPDGRQSHFVFVKLHSGHAVDVHVPNLPRTKRPVCVCMLVRGRDEFPLSHDEE